MYAGIARDELYVLFGFATEHERGGEQQDGGGMAEEDSTPSTEIRIAAPGDEDSLTEKNAGSNGHDGRGMGEDGSIRSTEIPKMPPENKENKDSSTDVSNEVR